MTPWRSQQLAEHHQLEGFACGHEDLDHWLTGQARRAQQAGTAATFVWSAHEDPQVVAYFVIAPTLVRREDHPSRRMAGGYSDVPGYLLARLALDVSLHGQGLGSELLVNALERVVTAASRASGRVIVVDAIDDAAVAFYAHHGFRRVGDTARLAITIATARSTS